MNLILYQEDVCSIRDSLYNMTYNFIRSHHYVMFHLARALGCTNVLDGNPGRSTNVAPGSDLFYTLKEFPEFSFSGPTHGSYAESIGVLFHAKVTDQSYSRILQALSSNKYFIYYNSDPEFNTDYCEGKMLLQFIKDNPEDVISKLFYSRCICILTGFEFMKESLQEFRKPVIVIPQIVNPNIPRLKSVKEYDVWMINTSPFHKKVADKFKEEGLSTLVLTRNGDYCDGHDFIECPTAGLNLDFLLASVSLCKYYFGSYPFLENQDYLMREKYSAWNHTSKIFESYYANSYWISSSKNLRQVLDILNSDEYKKQKQFNKYVESNFSLSNYDAQFKDLVQICKESIK